ncbi:MAG: nucleoside recognition domain-containing protein [Pedobacter sp.]|uniref:nucleoside recognition domain-containing protein n=1 Tax=Pedobacter sp. TaxID=1411316 RepID=UPI0028083D82|nr:nucleoside recognition domain-containing protein [Pedobacter sp.]MDQ8006229.1 nucleoside recognition domain-containing protein [Pedobacter sp.]
MALSRIWSAFIIVAILVASIKCFFFGQTEIFSWMVIGKADDPTNLTKVDGVIQTSLNAVQICIGLIGVMALFMGFMSIAEKAGGIRLLSRVIGPFFSKIFPEVPKGHPATGHMVMNFSANLLGLDNAATPFGIKAMESLQELNPNKAVASNAQIMFLCLHASGLTLIPVSIIAIRATLKSANPTEIFIPCMIATFVATMAAMIIVSIKQKINLFQPVIIAWVGSISAVIALMVLYVVNLNTAGLQSFSGLLSNGLMLLIFVSIVLGGLYKRIDIFDAFVEGAKGGFDTAIRIIPYLVGMLIAISLLRTSGTFEIVIDGFKNVFAVLGADTRFIDGIPTALIKPLSGSGARGMMIDTMTTHGADSFAGRLAAILQGSSDTTFYVIAVYFGAVNVKNSRYTVWSMLLADFVGICTAIGLCYLFFGNA